MVPSIMPGALRFAASCKCDGIPGHSDASPSPSKHKSDFLLTRGRRSREPFGRPRVRFAHPKSVGPFAADAADGAPGGAGASPKASGARLVSFADPNVAITEVAILTKQGECDAARRVEGGEDACDALGAADIGRDRGVTLPHLGHRGGRIPNALSA